MKYPILYPKDATDFFAMGLGPVTTALNAVVTEERNGIFILEMTVVVDDAIFPKLNEDCILKADAGHLLKDQRFRIKRIVPTEGNTATVYAEHVSYLAGELSLKPEVDLPTQNATSALNVWKGNIIDPNPFMVDSDIATTGSTHWRIDKVKNARQALGGVEGSILDVFGGEYRFDNYHISLLKKRGTTAKTMIAYGRNITTFEQERNISDTYTSVFPYALYSDDDQNQHLVTLPGYFVDAENIANYPNRKALPVDFSSQFDQDEVPTAEKLQSLAESYIKSNQIGVPKVSITVSFLDLSKTADYAEFAPLEEVNLCDDVRVIYLKLGVDVISKVVGVKWNVLSESYDEITIGSKAANLSTIINDVQDSTEKAEDNANNAQISANGKNTIFYGLYGEDGLGQPVANKIGDSWFKPDGEFTVLLQWNGTIWEEVVSEVQGDQITAGTINAANVRIINLDVNSLTGNKANFVQAGFNGVNSNVQINSSGLTATHNDGSQTIMNANGLFHKEGGTTYETHYLTYQTYIDINHDMSGPLRVQLPAIFKGKNFKARLTLSDTNGVTTDPNYYNLALLRICCSVVENQIDYANAIVPCIGYSFHKLLPNGSNYYFKIRATLTVTL